MGFTLEDRIDVACDGLPRVNSWVSSFHDRAYTRRHSGPGLQRRFGRFGSTRSYRYCAKRPHTTYNLRDSSHGSSRGLSPYYPCKRAGPGRLPGADRPDIGAGYAGASAALVAAGAFTALVSGLAALGSPFGVGDPVFVIVAASALPFVVPAAFVAGVATWRLLPEGTPLFGAVVLAAAVLSQSGADPVGAAVFAGGVGYVAIALTVWVTVPVGCLGGLIYKRVGVAT